MIFLRKKRYQVSKFAIFNKKRVKRQNFIFRFPFNSYSIQLTKIIKKIFLERLIENLSKFISILPEFRTFTVIK